MNYYSHSNNKIMIAHFPGNTKIEFANELQKFGERKFNKPDNIGFVTPFTTSIQNEAILIQQLKLNEYSYYNSIENKIISWNYVDKIKYILESLRKCKEEYSLILDTNDVAVLTDLDSIFDKFNEYKQEFPKLKILYNASIWMYPDTIVDYVKDRYKYGKYCYLNAGCCFGKTKDLIDFYTIVQDILNAHKADKIDSEQYYVRKAFDKHQDTVFFDYDCKIFQCWHKQEYKYEIDSETGEEKCILL